MGIGEHSVTGVQVHGGTGRYSVAFPRRQRYPACRTDDLGRAPLAVELMETPLALYRDRSGVPHALFGERHTSTDLDLLGRGIWRLLRQAERSENDDVSTGPTDDDDPVETTVTLRI